MDTRLPARARRRGSAILIAAAMIGALTVFAIFQQYLARQSMVVVQRAHLSSLAVLQGESAIEELVDQVAARSNDPQTELYKKLRTLMRAPWDPPQDLTSFLSRPEIVVHPETGFVGAPPGDGGELASEVLAFRARLRGPHYAEADRGTEEFTAVLTFEVDVKASNSRGEIERTISATYEVRGLYTWPPRPFDQAGFFVQNCDAVVDLRAIDQEKDLLIQDHEAFRQRLLAEAPGQGAASARLTELAGGMAALEDIEAALPDHASASGGVIFGPGHGGYVDEVSMNLARELVRRKTQRGAATAAFDAALGRPDEVGPAAYQVVSSLAGAASEFQRFHSQYSLVAPSSPAYQSSLEPYFDRLEADFYLSRVNLLLPVESSLFTRWATGSGGTRLNGVVALAPGGQEVRLAGQPPGQVILVAQGQHVILEGAGAASDDGASSAAIPDRLFVVSVGSDVTVTGDVNASIFMVTKDGTPGGKLAIRSGATLRGVVAVGDARPGQVALEGKINYDGSLRVRSPVGDQPPDGHTGDDGHDHGAGPPGVDPYTIVLSPMPIF